MLLPALRPNSLVIMDNAPFHNKPKIAQLLALLWHILLSSVIFRIPESAFD
jgi:predicted O-methyltransferase YrrM